MTEQGTIVGTVAYMSPEQAEGKEIDARSDVLSFGSMLYEMVTGRRAFQGESTTSTLSAILRDTPTPVRKLRADVPTALERIIGRCLEKNRDARYASGSDVWKDLTAVQSQLAAQGTGPAGMSRVPAQKANSWVSQVCALIGFIQTAPIRDLRIEEYWLDKYEVTNRQFKEFVDRGAYEKKEYWKYPFVKEGRVILWEEAMAGFRDATGRPGPETWEFGTYPKDQADYPVGGVSWYEAAAYAEFLGKSLPTVHHWVRAAVGFPISTIGSPTPGGKWPLNGPRT